MSGRGGGRGGTASTSAAASASTSDAGGTGTSIYYDATEHSRLLSGATDKPVTGTYHSNMPIPVPSIDEEQYHGDQSPWNRTASGAASTGGGNSILPPLAQGYLSFGVPSQGTPSLAGLSETETTTLRAEDETSSVLDGSYMGHVRAQSLLAKKWLNDVDIEPYMRLPGGSSTGGRRTTMPGRSGTGGSKRAFFREPLLEELLPTSRKETLFPAIHGPVIYRDTMAGYVYLGMLGAMVFLGTLLCFIYPAELRDSIIRSSSMFRAIMDSSWILAMAITIGGMISLAWVFILRWFPQETVYLMIYFAPITAFLVGVWFCVEFLHADPGGGLWLLVGALIGLTTSALFTTFIVARRQSIQQTVQVIRMAAEVLASNPGIYVASLGLLLGYIIFAAIWLLFFLHVLMLGHVDAAHKVWILSPWSYYLQAFFIFMLLWTSIILSYAQKCMIGGVLGRWYFFRTDTNEGGMSATGVEGGGGAAWESLKAAFTKFFGQICLASLVLTFVRITRGLIRLYRLIANQLEDGVFRTAFQSANLFFGFIERLFEHVTDLAIYVVTLTGDSFWASGRTVFKIFRRNMLVSFTTDLLSQLIFAISTTAVAALTGLTSYIFVAHILHSSYGFNASLIFSVLTWYALRFFTSIFSDTMDASFICFAIDLDTEKLHSPMVHQAFSNRIATDAEEGSVGGTLS